MANMHVARYENMFYGMHFNYSKCMEMTGQQEEDKRAMEMTCKKGAI